MSWPVQAYADALWIENPKLKVPNKVPLQVSAFDLRDVRLLDGPFKHAMDLDKAYLLSLDVDRLLHTFRLNAGLPSTAKPLGGWEEPKCELRGHFVGHYLSACALMYASTGDERLKEKGDAVVAGLAECQAKIGSGYLSAYPETFFDRVEARQRVWAPYYTLHKIYAGLLDMYVYCDNPQALEVVQEVRRLGHRPQRQAHRRADAEDAGQRARRHERGAGQPLRPDRRGEVPGDRPAVQPPGGARSGLAAARTSSPACTPTRSSPSSSARPASTS